MRILVTGGGSGGHVVPLRPIVRALRQRWVSSEIIFAYRVGDSKRLMLDDEPAIDRRIGIVAGKWRRYVNLSFREKVTDVPTILYNLRDVMYVLIGLVQSIFWLAFRRPDVIISKSGPASIPLGLVARLYLIPLITHDSDLSPSLTHRLVGRWAAVNAVASRAGEYPYPKDKIRYVGAPINPEFATPRTKAKVEAARRELGIPLKSKTILVMGGSLGARSINRAMIQSAASLMADEEVFVLHITGVDLFNESQVQLGEALGENKRYRLIPFVADQSEIVQYFFAADIVVSRGGATATAELAALCMPAVIIPAKGLADQLKNGAYLKKHNMAVVLEDTRVEQDSAVLLNALQGMLNSASRRKELGVKLHEVAAPDAAERIAALVEEVAIK